MKKAFTLIELLIVVAIIGILAAIAVPNFLNAQIRAKVAAARSEMRSLGDALEMYFLDHNAYPPFRHDLNNQWRYKGALARLTSPVSYMSSIPDSDPFNSEAPEAYGGATDTGNYGYTYVDYKSFSPNNYWPTWAKPLNIRWVLYSFGPDRNDDVGVIAVGHVVAPHFDIPGWDPSRVPYHPTNGLISNGDIMRSNHGDHSQ
ncbi:MAG: prepilin-type N-terminal cleavage/methylation domain-containing protein [bacterium]|nr:prepilin-type N-terminal cleavage/methylation domain-containing protein [bacterium]